MIGLIDLISQFSGINDRQRVHSIPAEHCILSGAQSAERDEPCRSILSPNVRLVLALAIVLIIFLLLLIFVIYMRNRTFVGFIFPNLAKLIV